MSRGRPVHVGPVTLRPRYNPSLVPQPDAAPELSEGYGAQLLPVATDPRQPSAGAAAWLLASAAALAAGGAASLTYAETWGPRGVLAADGTPFPLATAVGWLTALPGHALLVREPDGASASDGIWVLGARNAGTVTALVANMTSRPVSVELAAGDGLEVLDVAAFGMRRATVGGRGRG
jgi:hypothetical protein